MKLGDYMPELPPMAERMTQMNEQFNFLQLMKAGGGATGEAPTLGLDHVVNTWVRHQMAYRQQLVMDLQMVAFSVEEIRGPLNHITNEVFRRGIEFKPKVENPNREQLTKLEAYLDDCNVFDQGLEEVLRQFHFDVNSIDDGFLYIAKEYKVLEDGSLRSKVQEVRRLNPALVEFDLDAAGLPKNAHFICPIHRDEVNDDPSPCEEPDCGQECKPVMYKYYHRNKHIYLFDSEVIHASKFNPSETYGWSPILTIFEKALTIIGMDKNLFRYFFERKMPASMMMVFTDDPESLRRERENIAQQTRQDPNYIPMVAVSSRNQRGRVELLRLFHTLQEMDYLPVRNEIRERVAAMWGVTPAWQGAPEAFGGLSTQTQQLVVMSRVVEGDQRIFHEKVFPLLLEAFGVTDWEIALPNPEEKAEATRISFAQQRAQVVMMYQQLGFDVKLKESGVNLDDAEFIIDGEAVPMTQMQGEQMAIGVKQMEEQAAMQEEQMNQMQATQEGMDGINPAPGNTAAAPMGGEGMGAAPANAGPLQMMWNGITKGTQGLNIESINADVMGRKEKDVDADADERARKGENDYFGLKDMGTPPKPKAKAWMIDLMEKGYTSPVIKEVSPDNKQLWFVNDGLDYVANLNGVGITHVQKAKMVDQSPRPQISYAPSALQGRKKDKDDDDAD